MRVYAVVMPPVDRVDDLFQRLGASHDESLTWEPPSGVRAGICFFGNLILADLHRLATTLSTVIAETSPFDLRFGGGGALGDNRDDSVWTDVGGDVEELRSLERSIANAARSEGLMVDRRWFRPCAQIARINGVTTVDTLQRTLNALLAYEGDPWEVAQVALVEVRAETGEKPQPVSILEVLPLRPVATDGFPR
jgi:2'-5' RNA ligase